MPSIFPHDIPVAIDEAGYLARSLQCGSYTICNEQAPAGSDPAPLFEGLPDNRCQAEHVGLLVKGEVVFRYADHDETVTEGQVYHVFPGHLPLVTKDAEIIEFTLTSELNETIAAVTKNIEAGVRPIELAAR